MNDIPTYAILFELMKRMETQLYNDVPDYDAVLTDMPKEDTMGMYFVIEEYMIAYRELIEERRNA